MTGPLDHGSLRLIDLLSAEAKAAIAASERRSIYQDGQLIFACGDRDERLLIVREGAVRMGRTDAEGREMILAVLGPGHFIGLVSMLAGRKRGQNAVAVGTTVIGHLGKDEFLSLMEIHPEIATAALPATLSRLRAALNYIDDIKRLPIHVHTAVVLEQMLDASEDAHAISWSQADIALAVGSSRVSVGKALKQLEREGLISQKYARIEIADARALATWIQAARTKYMADRVDDAPLV